MIIRIYREWLFFAEQDGCKVAGGYDYCDGDLHPGEDSTEYLFEGHGTFVSSIAAGDPGGAPGALLYNYRFMTLLSFSLCSSEFEGDMPTLMQILEEELATFDSGSGQCTQIVM